MFVKSIKYDNSNTNLNNTPKLTVSQTITNTKQQAKNMALPSLGQCQHQEFDERNIKQRKLKPIHRRWNEIRWTGACYKHAATQTAALDAPLPRTWRINYTIGGTTPSCMPVLCRVRFW